MNNWLKYLVGLSAVVVAGCAAYFSVTGLGVLFAGAAISVMVMAGSLEFAKLVAATYLKQEWDNIKGFNKWYLTISVGTLMLITSAGIFGYLSNAFQQQNLELQKIEREVSVFENKIKQNESEITRYSTQLTNQQNIRNSQENNLSKVIEKNGSTSRLTQMVKTADKEITSISAKINKLTQDNNIAADSINSIRNKNIGIEREVGGFRFVADAFGLELNTVVKFFIFIIVIVFDPLAVALIIAFNGLIMNKRKDEIVTTKPHIDEDEVVDEKITLEAKDIVAEVSRLRLSENDLKKLEEVLLNPPPPNEFLTQAAEKYNEEVEKKEPFSDMLVPTDTPLPTDTPTPLPTDTPTPTPTPTETGTPTPTPTYLDKINVIARENSFFNSPAEGYTDGLINEENSTIEPTEEEELRNFSIIEPNNENIFQEEEEELRNFSIIEPNNENIFQEEEEVENISEVEINEVLNEVQTETFSEKPTTLNNTFSEEDEKKNLIEYQQPMLDLETLEGLKTEETSELTDYSTESQVEDLYWEKDDNNPNQIIYDLENNQVIIPSSEEEIITPTPTPKNVISRNVSPRRRNFR